MYCVNTMTHNCVQPHPSKTRTDGVLLDNMYMCTCGCFMQPLHTANSSHLSQLAAVHGSSRFQENGYAGILNSIVLPTYRKAFY